MTNPKLISILANIIIGIIFSFPVLSIEDEPAQLENILFNISSSDNGDSESHKNMFLCNPAAFKKNLIAGKKNEDSVIWNDHCLRLLMYYNSCSVCTKPSLPYANLSSLNDLINTKMLR